MPTERLQTIATGLREASQALRSEELPAEEVTRLVDRCAQLAGEAGSAVDEVVRSEAIIPTLFDDGLPNPSRTDSAGSSDHSHNPV